MAEDCKAEQERLPCSVRWDESYKEKKVKSENEEKKNVLNKTWWPVAVQSKSLSYSGLFPSMKKEGFATAYTENCPLSLSFISVSA